MIKGIDYTGITVSFYCHDGQGNYILHKRNENCRDEHGCWDCGGGGLKFGESLEAALHREVKEEFGAEIINYESLGVDEVFREHDGQPTHWISFRYRVELDRGKVINGEPEKHDEIGWYRLDNLPTPLHSQMSSVLEKYKDKLV